jgi:hypothetical protein
MLSSVTPLPRTAILLALALVLPSVRAFAQPTHELPPAPPAADASAPAPLPAPDASAPVGTLVNSAGTPSGQIYSGVAAALPASPMSPAPVLSFNDFAADYSPKKDLSQRWLSVRAGYIEIDQPPPSSPNPASAPPVFSVPSLPSEILNNIHFVELTSLIGAKNRYENVTMLDHDPHGRALPFTLPMGQIIYFLARQDTDNGLDFDFYYYDASSLEWIPSPVDDKLLLPKPTVIMQYQSLNVPADRYVLMPTTEHAAPPHPGSTARPIMLYGYVILVLHYIQGPPSAATDTTTHNPTPAPYTGDVLSTPPTNPGSPLMAPLPPPVSP